MILLMVGRFQRNGFEKSQEAWFNHLKKLGL